MLPPHSPRSSYQTVDCSTRLLQREGNGVLACVEQAIGEVLPMRRPAVGLSYRVATDEQRSQHNRSLHRRTASNDVDAVVFGMPVAGGHGCS